MVSLPVLLIIDENFNTAIEKGQPADHEIISQTIFIKNPNIKNHPIKRGYVIFKHLIQVNLDINQDSPKTPLVITLPKSF